MCLHIDQCAVDPTLSIANGRIVCIQVGTVRCSQSQRFTPATQDLMAIDDVNTTAEEGLVVAAAEDMEMERGEQIPSSSLSPQHPVPEEPRVTGMEEVDTTGAEQEEVSHLLRYPIGSDKRTDAGESSNDTAEDEQSRRRLDTCYYIAYGTGYSKGYSTSYTQVCESI